MVEYLTLRNSGTSWRLVPSLRSSREPYPDTGESGETYDVECLAGFEASYDC